MSYPPEGQEYARCKCLYLAATGLLHARLGALTKTTIMQFVVYNTIIVSLLLKYVCIYHDNLYGFTFVVYSAIYSNALRRNASNTFDNQ